MKKTLTLFTLLMIVSGALFAQSTEGFATVTNLNPVSIHTNLGDQPQSKVWTHDGKWWAVMPETETGTHIWRLDGTTWTKAFQVAPDNFTRADVKKVGDVVHILLFRGGSLPPRFTSVEYVPTENTYKFWSVRPTRETIPIAAGANTATIDIDTKDRMWLTYNGENAIYVKWSDYPYATWSEQITLATGTAADDISAVVALPALEKIGVMWSNQNTGKYGFRTHTDGENVETWTADEVPAEASAINSGRGMANNHLNLAVADNGTLYSAIKTRYSLGQTQVALLVRRPDGTWDDLYEVTTVENNRPIVILNEATDKLKVIYAAPNAGGIYYKESPMVTSTTDISFGSELQLISTPSDYATSTKDNYTQDIVIFSSTNNQAYSVLATDNTNVTSVDDGIEAKSSMVAYPNPFDSKATINFTLPESGEYQIALYDIKGTQLSTLQQNKGVEGQVKTVTVDGSELPGGLYLVRLQTYGKTSVLKLVLQR